MSKSKQNGTALAKRIVEENYKFIKDINQDNNKKNNKTTKEIWESENEKTFKAQFSRKFQGFLQEYYKIITTEKLNLQNLKKEEFEKFSNEIIEITRKVNLRDIIEPCLLIDKRYKLFKFDDENSVEQIEFMESMTNILAEIYLTNNPENEQVNQKLERLKAIYILLKEEYKEVAKQKNDNDAESDSKKAVRKAISFAETLHEKQIVEELKEEEHRRKEHLTKELICDVRREYYDSSRDYDYQYINLYNHCISYIHSKNIDTSDEKELRKVIEKAEEQIHKELMESMSEEEFNYSNYSNRPSVRKKS